MACKIRGLAARVSSALIVGGATRSPVRNIDNGAVGHLTCNHLVAYLASLVDDIFKALADPARRALLDQLHHANGQTLGQLCRHLRMTRQGVTKHLGFLINAGLIVPLWRGREKLHYLNPVPLKQIAERWIDKHQRRIPLALRELERGLDSAESSRAR